MPAQKVADVLALPQCDSSARAPSLPASLHLKSLEEAAELVSRVAERAARLLGEAPLALSARAARRRQRDLKTMVVTCAASSRHVAIGQRLVQPRIVVCVVV